MGERATEDGLGPTTGSAHMRRTQVIRQAMGARSVAVGSGQEHEVRSGENQGREAEPRGSCLTGRSSPRFPQLPLVSCNHAAHTQPEH